MDEYQPTYKEVFTFGCFGWTITFAGQLLNILSYIAVLSANIWVWNRSDFKSTNFGLFAKRGDGPTIYYWDDICYSTYGPICSELENAGKAMFGLLMFTLFIGVVHAGLLATFKLGNAMWYKRGILVGTLLWQGAILTICAIWWTFFLLPDLEHAYSVGSWHLDRILLYCWIYPGFIYLIYVPFALRIDFHVEAAPGSEQEYKQMKNEKGARVDAQGIPWGPHKPTAPYPGRSPSAYSHVSNQSLMMGRFSSDGETSAPSSMPATLAPHRPPPPKSRPNVKKWKKEWDPTYQQHYYVNIKTNESQWELPADYTD